MKMSSTLSKTALLVVASFGIACGLRAQDKSSFDGTWDAEVTAVIGPGAGIATKGLVLTVNGKAGYWEVLNPGLTRPSNPGERDNSEAACRSLKTPIEDVQATADTLKFKVMRSKMLRGCPDYLYDYKLVDGKLIGEIYLLGPSANQPFGKAVATRRK